MLNLQTYKTSEKLKLWAERIRLCKLSGMTVSEWCERNKINYTAYYRWQRKVFDFLAIQNASFSELNPLETNQTEEIAFVEVPALEASLHEAKCKDQGNENDVIATIQSVNFTVQIFSNAKPEVVEAILKGCSK